MIFIRRKYQIKSKYSLSLLLAVIFLSGISSANAQFLSPAGHIIIPDGNNLDAQVQMENQSFLVQYQGKNFEGNTLFKTENGFLAINGNYENVKSDLFFYDEDAILQTKKTFPHIINLQFSPNKKYLAFYADGFIYTIQIQNFEINKCPGSTLFAINNFGELTHVSNNRTLVYVDGTSHLMHSPVTKIVNFNNNWYYITKHNIFKYDDATIHSVYAAQNGIIFDVKIYNDEWYISTRTKNNTQYVFSLHQLKDFEIINNIDHKIYKRNIAISETPSVIPAKFQHRNNELIKNPLDFNASESYQSIGNTYNEIQEYSQNSTYLHPGVDLFGEHLENVHSVKNGFVKAILTTSGDYHWRIAIANNNGLDSAQGYLYAHLDEQLIPVIVGDTIAEGEVIGQLVDFPVTGFVHCHFARIVDKGFTWSGSWWTFDDPLYYMTNFRDTTAPVFEDAINGQKFAFRNSNGDYLSSDNVYGEVDIISKCYDQINTFWKVDVHKIGFMVKEFHIPMPIITDDYSFNFNMFNDTYFNGPYVQDIIHTMYSRDATCFSTGNYNERAFYHILSNSNGDDTITAIDSNLIFNTSIWPNDDYVLYVWAQDAAGNTTEDSMVFTINNFVGIDVDKKNTLKIYPNPATDYLMVNINEQEIPTTAFEIYSVIGEKVLQGIIINNKINLLELNPGLYILKMQNTAIRFVKK